MSPRARDHWTLLLALAGLGNLTNGLWMLAAPLTWYTELPGGVPDFGPYNEHFIRDLGCMFVTWGAALCVAARRPATRLVIVSVLALWFTTHALLHVYDTARGLVGPEHWVLDLPLCYAPAALLLGMVALLRRGRR